jgi:hypothetical protein
MKSWFVPHCLDKTNEIFFQQPPLSPKRKDALTAGKNVTIVTHP